jgi:hypothetical protein
MLLSLSINIYLAAWEVNRVFTVFYEEKDCILDREQECDIRDKKETTKPFIGYQMAQLKALLGDQGLYP